MINQIKERIAQGGSSLLFATIIVVNAGNYLLNLLLGRVLGPEAFAEVGVLATGVLMLSFFALGFQLTAAKYSAAYTAEGSTLRLQRFSHWFERKSLHLGYILAAVLILSAGYLRDFLHLRSALPLYIIAIGIPMYLQMSAGRGHLQGRLHFGRLAGSYLLEMIGRLLITALLIGLLVYWSAEWSAEAVALGFLASFAAAWWIVAGKRQHAKADMPADERKKIFSFMGIVAAYEFTQILISHSDVMLVKHYFSNEEAGLYTALALIGRIVFFATWSVVTLLFPKVVQRQKQGLPHRHLFYRSLLLVMGAGVGITFVCYGFSDLIIALLFGSAFGAVSQLLWLYAAATTLFACANVFAYYYLSLNQYLPVVLSGLAGILQILLIVMFHQTIITIIYIQILLMGALFLTMLIFHLFKNQKHEKVAYRPGYSLSAQ